MRTLFETKVAQMTVVQLRKVAGQYGIKNASKFRRPQLSEMIIDAMVAEEEKRIAEEKKAAAKVQKTDKRYKAAKIAKDEVEQAADKLIIAIKNNECVDLFNVNRKVLIEIMKQLHCKMWYRTYDKPTMVSKITKAMAA